MATNSPDYTLLLFALTVLLLGAHAGGYVSERLRQPRVFGEIIAGLVFGPTVLGHLFPAQYAAVFVDAPGVGAALGAFSQVGLLLLMFCSGGEICSVSLAWEKRTSLFIAAAGTLLPFAAGVVVYRFWDLTAYFGRARHAAAFVLVFAIAVAVTSIPVISRILYDLGILKSTFSRIVLSAAVLEDVALYAVLAVALSLVGGGRAGGLDLVSLAGLEAGGLPSLVYHSVVTLLFLLLALRVSPLARGRRGGEPMADEAAVADEAAGETAGGAAFERTAAKEDERPPASGAVALRLVLILTTTAAAVFLGVSSIFGALVAGIVFGGPGRGGGGRAFEVVKDFSFAFFIPLYFVSVGLKLDLLRDFEPAFFAAFFAVACAAKLLSIYAGALLAGEGRWGSLNLAVAMNARGGPGIVLAVVSLEAGVINESFYTSLVLLSLVTSLLAGVWLGFVLRRGWPLL